MNIHRPLLAATLTEELTNQLQYPVFASPKLDGIRMRIFPGLGGVSRKHLLLPNRHLQRIISKHPEWAYLDGEVIVGSCTDPRCFNITQSAIMSEDGEPDFKFYVFDSFENPDQIYCDRFSLEMRSKRVTDPAISVPQDLIMDYKQLLHYEARQVALGYEGIMIRSLDGKYKFGRSTAREGILFKVKRFEDAEATIVDILPLERNLNTSEQDELGYTKRSSCKAGKQVDELMGKIIVEMDDGGLFKIGSGFTENDRRHIWNNRDKLIGKVITFKYQKHGMKDAPRIPIFKGFRED